MYAIETIKMKKHKKYSLRFVLIVAGYCKVELSSDN
jgi:hypothetical protein